MRGLLIAGTHSGAGKTTFSLGLMAALRRRGLSIQPFKIGPDFIDPSHHKGICGRPSRNLDGWMLSPERNREIFRKFGSDVDVSLVEGVMGLYDGHGDHGESGSSAQIAKWLGLPVLLVLDARGMARSAAAMVLGYQRFDPALRLAGILLNRVGSERHAGLLKEAIALQCAVPVLGYLPREEGLALAERHLGLVPAEEVAKDSEWIDHLAGAIEGHCALDEIMNLALLEEASAPRLADSPQPVGEKIRLAVARDEAFSFYYPENLEALERAGAELLYFSPLNQGSLPAGISGLYLGGGYPEVHAARLEVNRQLRGEIRQSILSGLPVYAECGGLIYLTQGIEMTDGRRFEMVGALPDRARMLPRRKALGYAEVRLRNGCMLGPAGTILRGHEFHYSELVGGLENTSRSYDVISRREGASRQEGYSLRRVLASYIHLRFDSAPHVAERFVEFLRGVPPREGAGADEKAEQAG